MDATVLTHRLWTIAALEDAVSFLEGLSDSDKKKIWALLQRTAQNGPPSNKEKFHKLEGEICEFKSHQIRILCFFGGRHVIVVTHGFQKKRDRTPKKEIRRAERLMQDYERGLP